MYLEHFFLRFWINSVVSTYQFVIEWTNFPGNSSGNRRGAVRCILRVENKLTRNNCFVSHANRLVNRENSLTACADDFHGGKLRIPYER